MSFLCVFQHWCGESERERECIVFPSRVRILPLPLSVCLYFYIIVLLLLLLHFLFPFFPLSMWFKRWLCAMYKIACAMQIATMNKHAATTWTRLVARHNIQNCLFFFSRSLFLLFICTLWLSPTLCVCAFQWDFFIFYKSLSIRAIASVCVCHPR